MYCALLIKYRVDKKKNTIDSCWIYENIGDELVLFWLKQFEKELKEKKIILEQTQKQVIQ
jgi:hypothetical protein